MVLSKHWRQLGMEAELAASQLALGITALGRAHNERPAEYTKAFFGLANGLERLGKLILLADYAIDNHGKFPTNDYLKKTFGHRLDALLDASETICLKRKLPNRPNEPIHGAIVQTLTEFAALSRYYNLDFLAGGKAASTTEPIGAWWKRVAEPILERHYKDRRHKSDRAMAEAMGTLVGDRVLIRRHVETGESVSDLVKLMERASATRVVQTYGRVYTMQIVRWLSNLITHLAHLAYVARLEPFLGIEEPFKYFLNEDAYVRRRKSWAIYP